MTKLHKELKPYLQKGPTFEVIKHPLVFAVPYFKSDFENDHLNKTLQFKKEYIQNCISKKEPHSYIFMHEKPYRLQAFYAAMDEHKIIKEYSPTYWKLLRDVWVTSENVWEYDMEWRILLNSKNKNAEKFMTLSERKALDKMFKDSETIEIYRGACERNKNGLSYSLEKGIAQWFANRFAVKNSGQFTGRERQVYTKRVRREDIFAYIKNSEEEIILFWNLLNG